MVSYESAMEPLRGWPVLFAVAWGSSAEDDGDEADQEDNQNAAADEQHEELAGGVIHGRYCNRNRETDERRLISDK